MSRIEADEVLLDHVAQAVCQGGRTLLSRFRTVPAPATLPDLLAGIDANDAAVEAKLRDALLAVRRGSQWAAYEEEEGALPVGEWWVADPAEGNVNHLHGRSGWGVTATLVRDGEPVLGTVNVPLTGETYTALAGQGAFMNGLASTTLADRLEPGGIVADSRAMVG